MFEVKEYGGLKACKIDGNDWIAALLVLITTI